MKLNKNHKEIISYIKHLLSIDITEALVLNQIKSNYITVENDWFNGRDLARIEYLGIEHNKYKFVKNGHKKTAIKF